MYVYLLKKMNFIQYTVYGILILTAAIKAENVKENGHLCQETVTRFLDDGLTFNETVFVCCPGYIYIDTSAKCLPICHRPCIYGFCKAPNICECIKGYEMKNNECVPICKKKCVNGYCSKPDVCGCQNGFEIDLENNTQCLPTCNPKCEKFSKCTKSFQSKPNSCKCIEGYFTNEATKICEPYCKNKCDNGFCIRPDTCSCNSGYEFHYYNRSSCFPKCEPKCQKYSSCKAPNVCVCDEGYKLNKINKNCEPICKDQVENSRCIKPPNTWTCVKNYQHDRRIDKCVLEYCSCNSNGYCIEHKYKCVCYDGFTKNISGQCEPQCQPECKNSLCVANNVCECFDGHHKTPLGHICEKNDFCNGKLCKNGECLISGECRCKAGFVKSLSYTGQIQCDIVEKFIGKVMTMILGVPVLLASSVLIIIYVFAKKKSHNVEEQEMILINRN